MTTKQLKLAVRAQTLLEMMGDAAKKDIYLQKAKECIDEIILEEDATPVISTAYRGGTGLSTN